MRRFLAYVVAGLAAVSVVAIASASGVGKNALVTPDSYLPGGVQPCVTNWLAPSCDVSQSGYSQLKYINTQTVGRLHQVWQQSFNGSTFTGKIEQQPICCANGMMYQQVADGLVALDPLTGNIKWRYKGVPNNTFRIDSPTPVTTVGARDEAYDPNDNLVYSGQQDGSVVAIKASTGQALWTSQISGVGTYGAATHTETTPFTTYYNNGKVGMVFTAPNGGESPIRGHIDAYNAKNGRLLWRSYMTPDPNQYPFILTWANPAEASVAGATVWSLPSVDPQLGSIYFGTGNPYPYTGRQPGKDLWSDTLVSLNVNTGAMRWFYQTTHHDLWDYDCPTPTLRVNVMVKGVSTPVLAGSCKTGYLYELNARNGHPIFPIPETPVPNLNGGKGAALNNTWPTQPEPTDGAASILIHCPTEAQAQASLPGYPTASNGTAIVRTCPFPPTYNDQYLLWGPFWGNGGTDYPRMSFNPATNDLYICANVTLLAMENRSPTDYHLNSITSGVYTANGWSGSVTAINLATNTQDWQDQYQANKDGACYSGTMATAGGLVFAASRGRADQSSATLSAQGVPYGGYLIASDAKTGQRLWSWQAPDIIQAPPITYMFQGKQYVAIYVAGPTSSGMHDRLTVFSL
jgi:quinohemoprotein ethanol dehydrogenase